VIVNFYIKKRKATELKVSTFGIFSMLSYIPVVGRAWSKKTPKSFDAMERSDLPWT
jgi:hypothetical protein